MYFECRHIMPNGLRCHSPALRDTYFCYHHTRLNRLTATPESAGQPLKLPILEDRSAIQIALSQILDALGSSKIDTRKAGLFLYGLQIASQNVERDGDILPRSAIDSITHTGDGEELAPEKRVCFSTGDCSTCTLRDNCDDFELDDDEDDNEDNDEENEDNEQGTVWNPGGV